MGNFFGKAREVRDKNLLDPLNAQKKKIERQLFPVEEELFVSMLTNFSTGALTGISTLNGFAAFGVASAADVGVLQALVHMSLFTFLPIGIMGVVLAMAAAKSKHYVGYASGFLLFELLYTIVVGAFCSIVKLKEDVKEQGFWAVVIIAFLLCIMVLIFWSYVFPHPKCLRKWYTERTLSNSDIAKEASARAVEAAEEAKKAKEAAIVACKASEEDAEVAQRAASDAVAAGDATQRAGVASKRAGDASHLA